MKHRILFYLLLLVSTVWARSGQAATITTSVLNGPNFCQSTPVRVSYTVSGSLDPSNVFTAQLSDETGSFATPTAIGSLAGTAGGTITGILPAGVVTGSGYRVRVVASSPATIGTDNGQDLSITNIGTVTAGSNSPLCVGGNLLLTATTVPGASYSWTGPAKFTSVLQNPAISNVGLNRTGTYTVTASANGCSATSSVSVTVNALPNASVTPRNAVICAGQSVALYASGGTSYAWSPATGLSSTTIADPVASPTASTIYTVTVTNAAGCSSTAETTVQVRATPVLTVSPNQTICAGSSVTLSVSGAQNYTWSPSTGLNNPHSATPIASPATTTTYTVIGDNGGCSATATVTITVEPLPTPSAGPDRVLCSGQSAQLGSAPVAGLTYSWSPSTGLSNPSAAQPTITLNNTGMAPRTTVYTLTAVSANNCVGSSTVRITVNPVVVAYAGVAQTFCSGGSAPLGGAAAMAGYTYNWSPTTGLADPNAAQTTVSLPNTTGAPTTTTYTLTAASNGCSNTSTVAVTVNPATSAAFAYNAASYCQSSTNPTPTISGNAGGMFTSTSGLNINAATGQIDLPASKAGTYTVTYSVGGPCPSSNTATVTVSAPASAAFNYGGASLCASGTATPALGTGSSAGTFSSTTGLVLNAATGSIDLTASTPGTYIITNTVSSNGACSGTLATATVTINALPPRPTLTAQYNGSTATLTSSAATGNQFYQNGVAIAGATSPSYVVNSPAQLGSYTVTTTSAQGCTSLPSAPLVVTATAKQLADAQLQLYPNPTPDGKLTVTLTNAHQPVQLSVLNALGQVVYRAAVPASSATAPQPLDLGDLPTGVYLLRATTAEGTATRRFGRE
jgi:hypothetical protein